MKLINLTINYTDKNQVVNNIISFVREGKKKQIVTLNTEMIMSSLSDKSLSDILENSYLIPESSGLLIASEYEKSNNWVYPFSWLKILIIGLKIVLDMKLKGELKTVLPGVDLCYLIAKVSEKEDFKILLLGGRDGVANEAANVLKEKFPRLKINGVLGGEVGKDDKEILKQVKNNSSDIILVAFGHGKQEKWLAENLGKVDARVGVGVGGSLDFISGKVKRAPLWMRNAGLEWLFRMIVQPWRIKRQLALIKFLNYLARS